MNYLYFDIQILFIEKETNTCEHCVQIEIYFSKYKTIRTPFMRYFSKVIQSENIFIQLMFCHKIFASTFTPQSCILYKSIGPVDKSFSQTLPGSI